MSKDIRSFFISSKKPQSKTVSEDKPRKKVNTIVLSDDEDSSPSKKKNSKVNKTKVSDKKGHSKKRAIISSDEDEDISKLVKNKKAKVIKNDTSKNDEKLVEIIESPVKLLNQKPLKRINAVTVTKKSSKESIKKTESNIKTDFTNEDDDFDATLMQLDVSQNEDEYLTTINDEKSPYFKTKEKDVSDTEKKEKEKSNSKDKKDKETHKNVKRSPSKNKVNEKDHSDTKEHNSKGKKKKDHSHPKLEIEKEIKSPKSTNKTNDGDYNEIIQEKIEKKKHNAILYQNYLNRGGARNPGSKEIPQGAEQCFANLRFLITGILDSLEREEAEGIIKQYGGTILHTVSKKLNYLIVGEEAGPSKLTKAESLGVKQISEDDFLNLLRTLPAGAGVKIQSDSNNKRKRENSSSRDNHKSSENTKKNKDLFPKDKDDNSRKNENITGDKTDLSPKDNHKSIKTKDVKETSPPKIESKKESQVVPISETKMKNEDSPVNNKISETSASEIKSIETKSNKSLVNDVTNKLNDGIDHATALVEKYRPKELKQIIGQTGDKSNAKKLHFWLSNWFKNHNKDSKVVKPKFPARDENGTIFKAALLSGPPGIGKTTTAYVVCAQLGFEVLEFNASDTRSKKLLQEEIAGILSNKTMKSFLTNNPDKKNSPPKHVLLMDEVDGMAGNEDRGGMQELIAFIKSTEVPIICICNDRNSPKIRTLSNYTFDLRFQKPRLEQIRGAMMSICFKEGIKITPEELNQIIQSTNQDIRQVINHIAVLSAKSQTLSESKEHKKYKNLKLGPWDVVRKVFSTEEHKNMSIHDKSDLFFHDYNIAALFVEENYLGITPAGPKNEIYKKLAKCSESLAIGDTIENMIRSKQAWGLLPVQACFSSVIPGSVMSGYIHSQINFPSWLGRNSKKSKCDRLLQEITVHGRITTGASKEAMNLDYVKMLVDSIVRPLALEGVDGVDKAIDVMNKYHLTREDLDSLIELTKWPHTRDPMQSVDTKTKTAFTRAYNKCALYSSAGTMKKKQANDTQSEDLIGSDEERISDNDEDEDKIENDKLIKAKTSKAKSVPSESKEKTKKTVKNNSSRSKKK